MTVIIVLSAAVAVGFGVDTLQRHCERWCQLRDQNL
jgi:hypothetical protein